VGVAWADDERCHAAAADGGLADSGVDIFAVEYWHIVVAAGCRTVNARARIAAVCEPGDDGQGGTSCLGTATGD
jgi:hypothetical protein